MDEHNIEKLSTNNDLVELKTTSGDILSISPLGGLFTLTLRSVPVLTSVVRGDGKSIRTHICTPNFGKDHSGVFELKQHGNMRNEHIDVKLDDSRILIHHDITDSPHIYPRGISLDVTASFKDNTCTFDCVHTNSGDKPAPVNLGIHCYFYAPWGYTHTRINGYDMTALIKNNGNIELGHTNIISIPNQPDFRLIQTGFPRAVLWVGKNEKGEMDRNYLCIEPVEFLPPEFNSPQTLINPGESRTSSISLRI